MNSADIKITITIERSGSDESPRFRPHLFVGDTETYLGTCYGEYDAIKNSLEYLTIELDRGNYGKFAAFKAVSR